MQLLDPHTIDYDKPVKVVSETTLGKLHVGDYFIFFNPGGRLGRFPSPGSICIKGFPHRMSEDTPAVAFITFRCDENGPWPPIADVRNADTTVWKIAPGSIRSINDQR